MGNLIVFTAPSGAGKTTIVKHLLKKFDFLSFSVSATTREKRPGEIDGKDYYFVSIEKFQQFIANEELVEWQEVYKGQFYGTLKSEIKRIWASGKHILFDIDVKGALNVKKIYNDKCLAVFVKPPSLQILIERLKNRQTETDASLQRRILKLETELSFETKFDIVLENKELSLALEKAEEIILNYCK